MDADPRAQGRPPPAPYVLGPDPDRLRAIIEDPERQMLGARQEQWLAEEIAASGRRWATRWSWPAPARRTS